MFCTQCGASLPDRTNFCGSCGQRVVEVARTILESPAATAAAGPPKVSTRQRPAVITYFGVVHSVIAAVFLFAAVVSPFSTTNPDPVSRWMTAAVVFAFGVFEFAGAYGLLRLRPFGRRFLLFWSAVICLAIPVGPIIGFLLIRYLRKPHVRELFAPGPASYPPSEEPAPLPESVSRPEPELEPEPEPEPEPETVPTVSDSPTEWRRLAGTLAAAGVGAVLIAIAVMVFRQSPAVPQPQSQPEADSRVLFPNPQELVDNAKQLQIDIPPPAPLPEPVANRPMLMAFVRSVQDDGEIPADVALAFGLVVERRALPAKRFTFDEGQARLSMARSVEPGSDDILFATSLENVTVFYLTDSTLELRVAGVDTGDGTLRLLPVEEARSGYSDALLAWTEAARRFYQFP